MYRHLDAGWVLRPADGAHIPGPANRDRVEFLAWEAEGGVASPYAPSPIQADPTAVQARIDANWATRRCRSGGGLCGSGHQRPVLRSSRVLSVRIRL